MYIRRLRETWYLLFQIVWDSLQIIIIITSYVIGFSIVGYILFKDNKPHHDPFKYFETIREGIFNMFACYITSNFPDIMIPFIKNNSNSTFFFITYTMIGQYFLNNLLLGVIFISYRKIKEKNLDKY
jgi:hypothetical protein